MIRYHKTVPEPYTVNLVELSVGDNSQYGVTGADALIVG